MSAVIFAFKIEHIKNIKKINKLKRSHKMQNIITIISKDSLKQYIFQIVQIYSLKKDPSLAVPVLK